MLRTRLCDLLGIDVPIILAGMGAGATSAKFAAEVSNHGGLGRLMGGGLMALGTRLMGLGLGISEIQNVARELFRFGRDKIGADQMGEIIAGTPGLSQFA